MNYHRVRFRKLTLRALALRQSKKKKYNGRLLRQKACTRVKGAFGKVSRYPRKRNILISTSEDCFMFAIFCDFL